MIDGPYLFLASLEGAVMAAILALTALGLSLVFGVMRVVNVAHGEFFMLGAVVAWYCATWVTAIPGLPEAWGPATAFVAALIISPIIVGSIAYLADRLILQRLNYQPEATIVATIGLLYILQQSALSIFGPDARPVQAPFNWRIDFPWFGYQGYKLFVIAAAIVLLCLVWLLLTRSKSV